MMTTDDIRKVIEQIPNLNDFGVGVFISSQDRTKTRDEKEAEFKRDRESLLAGAEDCSKACEWLAGLPKRKTINPRHTSYGLKHVYERETRHYVTNGRFIAAAVHSVFKFKLEKDGPNVMFNISQKPLTEHYRRHP